MIETLKIKVQKILPKSILRVILKYYQRFLNLILNLFFHLKLNKPSKKIIVIGVTGTKGKSTVCFLAYSLLQALSIKTSLSSSDYIAYGNKLEENKTLNTMPGRGFLHKFLYQSLKNDCKIAIIEVTSEGLMYGRDYFVDFDIGIFLNLHPEHIQTHGSYEKYKKDKRKLFKKISKSKTKKYLNGKEIEKSIIANLDDIQFNYFTNFPVKKITFSLKTQADIKPVNWSLNEQETTFKLWQEEFKSPLVGEFNLYNILASLALLVCLKIDLNQENIEKIKEEISKNRGVPLRMELIKAKNFKILIDFAHTPESIKQVFETINKVFEKPKRIISIIGADGGLRDKWKRPIFGEICAKYSDSVVITDVNPYFEDGNEIIEQIFVGAKNYLEKWNLKKEIIKIKERKEAIKWAVKNAQEGDLIVSLVKGRDPYIITGKEKIPWNEKEVFLEVLKEYNKI